LKEGADVVDHTAKVTEKGERRGKEAYSSLRVLILAEAGRRKKLKSRTSYYTICGCSSEQGEGEGRPFPFLSLSFLITGRRGERETPGDNPC